MHNEVRGRRPTGVRAKTKLEEIVPVDLHQHKGERDIAPKSSNKKTSLHQEKGLLHQKVKKGDKTCTSTKKKGILHQKVQKKETKVAPGQRSNDTSPTTNLMF